MTYQKQLKRTVRSFAEKHGLSYTEALSVLVASRDDFIESEKKTRLDETLLPGSFDLDLMSEPFLSSGGLHVHGNSGTGKTTFLKLVGEQAIALGWDVVVSSQVKYEYESLRPSAYREPQKVLDFLRREAESRHENGSSVPLLVILDECHWEVSEDYAFLARLAHESASTKIYLAVGDHGMGRIPLLLKTRLFDVLCSVSLGGQSRERTYVQSLTQEPRPLSDYNVTGPRPQAVEPFVAPAGEVLGLPWSFDFRISASLLITGVTGSGKTVLATSIAESFMDQEVPILHFGHSGLNLDSSLITTVGPDQFDTYRAVIQDHLHLRVRLPGPVLVIMDEPSIHDGKVVDLVQSMIGRGRSMQVYLVVVSQDSRWRKLAFASKACFREPRQFIGQDHVYDLLPRGAFLPEGTGLNEVVFAYPAGSER